MNSPKPTEAKKPWSFWRFVGRKFLLAFIIIMIFSFFNPHLWASNHVRNLHNMLLNGSDIKTLLAMAEDTEYAEILWSTRSRIEALGRVRSVPGGEWHSSMKIRPIIATARDFGMQRVHLINLDGDWYLQGIGEETEAGTDVSAYIGRPEEVSYPKCTRERKKSESGICLRSRWGQWSVVHAWGQVPSF